MSRLPVLHCIPLEAILSGWHEPDLDFSCPITHEHIASLLPKMTEADGVVFGSPVYTSSCTGNFRASVDRIAYGAIRGRFDGKAAVTVTTTAMKFHALQ